MSSVHELYSSGCYAKCLEWLSDCDLVKNKLKTSSESVLAVKQITNVLTDNLALKRKTEDNTNSTELDEITFACCKLLARSCPLGSEVQFAIVDNASLIPCISDAIVMFPPAKTLIFWHLLGNLCVQNTKVQALIWSEQSDLIMSTLKAKLEHWEICAMIMYNMFISGTLIMLDAVKLVDVLLENATPDTIAKSEWLQLFMDKVLTSPREAMRVYATLSDSKRLLFLYYISECIAESQSLKEPISPQLLQFLVKEFKKKSDCVLKTESTYVNETIAVEVHDLLTIIATASGNDLYIHVMANDRSLFLNCGCLLRAVIDVATKSDNVFTPIQKLSRVAPNSTEDSAFEQQHSYGFKTMLVRTLANLSHRNPENQEMAREMGIMEAILNCTGVDARNPLMREWSVLAVRNLCENNAENQLLVQSLTKIGDADNSEMMKEFNIELGSMRISGGS